MFLTKWRNEDAGNIQSGLFNSSDIYFGQLKCTYLLRFIVKFMSFLEQTQVKSCGLLGRRSIFTGHVDDLPLSVLDRVGGGEGEQSQHTAPHLPGTLPSWQRDPGG